MLKVTLNCPRCHHERSLAETWERPILAGKRAGALMLVHMASFRSNVHAQASCLFLSFLPSPMQEETAGYFGTGLWSAHHNLCQPEEGLWRAGQILGENGGKCSSFTALEMQSSPVCGNPKPIWSLHTHNGKYCIQALRSWSLSCFEKGL